MKVRIPNRLLWLGVGLASLLWVVYRVGLKPSRLAYPCVQGAIPVAAQFLGFFGISFNSELLARYASRARASVVFAVSLLLAAAIAFGLPAASQPSLAGSPLVLAGDNERATPAADIARNDPVGEAKGIHPGRVVWLHEPEAVAWDGRTGTWWSEQSIDGQLVAAMLSRTLRLLTGENDEAAAWESLFRYSNEIRGRGSRGYQPGETIAVKLNLNNSSYEWDTQNDLNVSPQVVAELVASLTIEAGVPEDRIYLADPSRIVGNPLFEPLRASYEKLHFVDREGGQGREQAVAAPEAAVHFAGVGNSGARALLPEVFAGADYIINIALLKAHSLAGVSLTAKNHFGSIFVEKESYSWKRGWDPSFLHRYVAVDTWGGVPGREMGSYSPLVELMGHRDLGGKTVLFLIDALYAAQTQNGGPRRWESEPFNGNWTASLFASQDSVALQSVGVDLMRNEPSLEEHVRGSIENFLLEAASAGSPPSGTAYDPEGDGSPPESLGVFERWNNPRDRQYSGNIGQEGGIELVTR